MWVTLLWSEFIVKATPVYFARLKTFIEQIDIERTQTHNDAVPFDARSTYINVVSFKSKFFIKKQTYVLIDWN